MIKQLRLLTLATTALLCGSAFAQPTPPYPVIVSGHVNGCSPANSVITIMTVQNTQPAINMTVQLDANCNYFMMFDMDSPQGWFQVSTPCQGTVQNGTGSYSVNVWDTLYVEIDLNCGGGNTDCLGVINGPAQPGTACSTALGLPGTWSASCSCVANTTQCNACFTVAQTGTTPNGGNPVPFSATFSSNCTSGGSSPYTYSWTFDGGITFVNVANPVVVFTAGSYVACLTVSDASGCTSTTCDSLLVDNNGVINPSSGGYDCLQILNGPNLPGAPCTTALGVQGTWSAACACIPNINPGCTAGFWVLQGYSIDSLNPNGGAVPIPNELWIWNLSAGVSPYQFFWNFGDGTSSTEAFPTHFYANGGPYMLCLTMSDAAGCTATYCDSIAVDDNGIFTGFIGDNNNRSGFTINVLQEQPTAISERETIEELALWPNPVVDAIGLSLVSKSSSRIEMSIIDLNGRLVKTTSNSVSTGNNRVMLPVADLENGIYMLRISDGTTTVSRRFVKQ